jgi:hypothetical protein
MGNCSRPPKEKLMTFKNKASEVGENFRHSFQETAQKVGHAVSETLGKGKHALNDVVLTATELAKEAKTKRENKILEKTREAVRGAGELLEKAGDKLKNAN